MQIMLVLLCLYGLVTIIFLVIPIISLTVGGVLNTFPKTRTISPIFTTIIPATAIASLSGGYIIGYIAIEHNNNLVFYGPLSGMIFGGVLGFIIGSVISGLWWYHRKHAI